MAEEPKTAEAATVETDLLGDPILPEAPGGLSLEERLAALEALTQKLLDYGAALQVDETQARLAALEAKTEAPFDPAELEGRLYEVEGGGAALAERLTAVENLQNGRPMETVCQAVDAVSRGLAALTERVCAEFGPGTMETQLLALEAKLARIAEAQPRPAYPKTIDELPSPFASEG